MNDTKKRPDYSLESVLSDQPKDAEQPKIIATVQISVESPEVRCEKGDCNQDYAPG